MKTKTINKIITKRFEQFLESITNEEVKKLVQKNSLISGGCIASMLLKEKINDYDIYFTNKETCLAVAKYYRDKMVKDDPNLVIKLIDMDEVLKLVPEDPERKYVEDRGFTQPGRVGLFCKAENQKVEQVSEEEMHDKVEELQEERDKLAEEDKGEKYRVLFVSPNAISLSHKVQIILRFYGTPEEIHSNFDFVHCTNYWLSDDYQLMLNQKALESLIARELVYIGSKYPIASVIRTRKFVTRGWSCNAGAYLKMCYQISKLNLDQIAVLEDQLVGVDVMYFIRVINALKSAQEAHKDDPQPFCITYEYISSIIDRIF